MAQGFFEYTTANQWQRSVFACVFDYSHVCVCVCVCVWEREDGSQLISRITAVISTLFITSSMCSVRFKIFKSVICQHYEVNTHSQD